MRRIDLPERPGWQTLAEKLGFGFHSMYGAPYWDETRAYCFTLEQIENDLEDPTTELWQMCLELVAHVVADPALMHRLAIPEPFHQWIAESWRRGDPTLYGRFDFHYDGTGPAKMLEFNADTPTALYETGFFQWIWLEQQIQAGVLPEGADQFNSVQDALITRLQKVFAPGYHLHFASVKDHEEERATVLYLEDCAKQAGLVPKFVAMEDIGLDHQGRFADSDNIVIDTIFKLYPWEDMFREQFGPALPFAPQRWIEPPWKAILSNKGILPLLWEMFPNHPNLLPSWFADNAPDGVTSMAYVEKPLFSREGANIKVVRPDKPVLETEGQYGAEGSILQQYWPAAKFDRDHMMIGSWLIGDTACGLCIREDKAEVTQDLSRFVPHFINTAT
ncbi:glutathionylspermidine synthase family protein [uncultured Tateyamaria sp.]|uniref:glutathionylspermidine synthase family protein n=1 Tax=uncultured Tateyamaria sp. TaxID=455651 RepID=UPI0026034F6C|nr:glutathionylspermidine synthase family protein [uncultured Tateyamaria sp.]